MSCFLRCKATFTPYLPKQQNPGVCFCTIFFTISSKIFTWILLSAPFSPIHLLRNGQSLHTALGQRYSFVTVFVVLFSRFMGEFFSARADKYILFFIILKVFSLKLFTVQRQTDALCQVFVIF